MIYQQLSSVCTIYPPPEIAKSDLPSNHLYDLPPLSWQVHFTIKSSVDLPCLYGHQFHKFGRAFKLWMI